MILEGLHEKDIFPAKYPFRLELNSDKDFKYPLHWHNAVEIVYAIKGDLKMCVNNTDYMLSEGEVLLIPPGEIHDVQKYGVYGKRAFIQFNLSSLDVFGGFENFYPYLQNIRKISSATDEVLYNSITASIKEIIREYENKDFGYELSLNARIIDIIVLLSRSLLVNNKIEEFSSSSKRIECLEKINKVLKYMEDNYRYEVKLKDAADIAGFSEYYFSRLFKEITEKNFHNYLNELRIKKAERLLAESGMTIAQIADKAGFNSFVTFNRLFKKLKGCSPALYKKVGV